MAHGHTDGPSIGPVRMEFILFALTLVAVAIFHNHTMQVALAGLGGILIWELFVAKGFLIGEHFFGTNAIMDQIIHKDMRQGEWAVILNLIGLLLGFAILAKHFEESGIPQILPKYLPDGWVRNIEFFYCTPDFPEILREQSHVVLDYLNVNPTAIDFFESHELGGKQPLLKTFNGIPAREQQRRFIKSLIYPDWDAKTFQTIKGDDFYNKSEMFHWFYKNPESENYLHAWRSNVQSQLAIITPRLLTLAASGVKRMVSFYSQHYIIGKLTKNETI
jgi:hypothetical protein